MSLKTALLLFSFLIFSIGLYGQNTDNNESKPDIVREKQNFKHFVGVAATSTLGRGLSYRFQPNKFGMQFTGLPIFRNDGEYTLNGGLKFMYTFLESENFNIYTYVGSMAIYEKTKGYISPGPWPPDDWDGYHRSLQLNSSLGAGYNFYLGKYFEFSVNVGYGIYRWHPDDFNFAFSNIAGGAGIYYKF